MRVRESICDSLSCVAEYGRTGLTTDQERWDGNGSEALGQEIHFSQDRRIQPVKNKSVFRFHKQSQGLLVSLEVRSVLLVLEPMCGETRSIAGLKQSGEPLVRFRKAAATVALMYGNGGSISFLSRSHEAPVRLISTAGCPSLGNVPKTKRCQERSYSEVIWAIMSSNSGRSNGFLITRIWRCSSWAEGKVCAALIRITGTPRMVSLFCH